MKKELQLTVTREEKVTIEVEFPIYTQNEDIDDYGGSTYKFTRLEANGRYVSISHRERPRLGQQEYEIEIRDNVMIRSAHNSELGKGDYACTKEEFDKFLAKAIESLQALQVIQE